MNPNRKVINGPRTGKSNMSCGVSGCKSVHRKDKTISFHTLPKEGELIQIETKKDLGDIHQVDRRQLWISNLKLKKSPSKNTKVCSLHFIKEDFHSTGCFNKRYLVKTAVPTQNLPTSEKFHEVYIKGEPQEAYIKKEPQNVYLIEETNEVYIKEEPLAKKMRFETFEEATRDPLD